MGKCLTCGHPRTSFVPGIHDPLHATAYYKPKDAACNNSLWLHCVSIGSQPVAWLATTVLPFARRDGMHSDARFAVSYGWTDGEVDGRWRG